MTYILYTPTKLIPSVLDKLVYRQKERRARKQHNLSDGGNYILTLKYHSN